MPIARSMGCLTVNVGCTEVYHQKIKTIGIGRIKAALRLNVSDLQKLMPISSP
jgi:hypothetical protein